MEKPRFIFEFPAQENRTTQYGEETRRLKEEFLQSHSRQDFLPDLKSHLQEKFWQCRSNEQERAVATEDVPRLAISDFDTHEEVNEPSDTSMALIVVPDPPEESLNKNSELAIVRVDNTATSEIASQSSVYNEEQVARNGVNAPTSSEMIAERQSTGNGHTAAPSAGVWDGPPRWPSSTVGILTVQCARCLKWRVVPSKEKYEAIREHIMETPWLCENALEWRPDAHCDLPSDLNQDSQMVWAIDKPNLPSSPPGWSRRVVVRKDCSTKFADVYYSAPDGKTLRSMVEVAKYIEEHPASVPQGTKIDHFSFTSPRPLPGIWTARKRKKIRSLVGVSSSQGEGKKARAPQPLAKQLAQRLLHGTTPPDLPVPPTFPPIGSTSFQQPVGPHVPGPSVPQSVQTLAKQAPTYPPAPCFNNPPNFPLFPSSLPPMRNPYPFPPSGVGIPTQTSRHVPLFSPEGLVSSIHAEKFNSSPAMAASGSKKQQQKSRLGVPSMSQTTNLTGGFPSREPNSF